MDNSYFGFGLYPIKISSNKKSLKFSHKLINITKLNKMGYKYEEIIVACTLINLKEQLKKSHK